MNRFVIAAALAVALGLGTSNKADAQIVYGYSAPTLNGGVETAGTVLTPFGAKTFDNYYNPFSGMMYGQSYTGNIWGMGLAKTYGYTPYGYNPYFGGIQYGTRFYQPNTYVNPYFGYGYGWARPR